MPTPESRIDQILRWRSAGLSTQSIKTTATQLWDLSPKQARLLQKKAMNRIVLEATSIDVLGELMLKYRQQEHALDIMSRELKRDDLKASFYNTHRKLLKDCCNTLVAIAEVRTEAGRDNCKPVEKEAERRKEEQQQVDTDMKDVEYNRQMGYFYETKHGIMQPANNLTSLALAIRDVIRMRMLPKSPYEDYLIAEALGALTEDEKKVNPETLSREERDTDLHTWNPYRDACPGDTRYREQAVLTQRLYLERLQEYNRIWAQAEAYVDGLMEAKGMKPHPDALRIGIPPVVRKAAEGDEQAIQELKDYVARNNLLRAATAEEQEDTYFTSRGMVLRKHPHLGRATSVVASVLIAFITAWMCLSLAAGPQNLVYYTVTGEPPRDEQAVMVFMDETSARPCRRVLDNHIIRDDFFAGRALSFADAGKDIAPHPGANCRVINGTSCFLVFPDRSG